MRYLWTIFHTWEQVVTMHHSSTKLFAEIAKNRLSLSASIVDFVAEHKRSKVILKKWKMALQHLSLPIWARSVCSEFLSFPTDSTSFQVRMTLGDYFQSPLNAAPRLAKATAAEGHDTCRCDKAAFSAFGAKGGIWGFGIGLLSPASSFIVALYV